MRLIWLNLTLDQAKNYWNNFVDLLILNYSLTKSKKKQKITLPKQNKNINRTTLKNGIILF